MAEFRQTLLLDDRWAAGIMTLRMPVELPEGFGPRPSMSFFLYNQDGTQAIARPYLDGQPPTGKLGPAPLERLGDMPKYHQFDNLDVGTNAPSHNFVYDFDSYRFLVNDRWHEVLSHDYDGRPRSGSVEALNDAFMRGSPVKVAISKFCVGLVPPGETAPEHEAFIHAGSCYYYTDRKLFITGTHPAVRVKPAIPLRYGSRRLGFLLAGGAHRRSGRTLALRSAHAAIRPQHASLRHALVRFEGLNMRLDRFLTVDDFKRVAERRVPRMFFQYADSGAYTEEQLPRQRGRLRQGQARAAGRPRYLDAEPQDDDARPRGLAAARHSRPPAPPACRSPTARSRRRAPPRRPASSLRCRPSASARSRTLRRRPASPFWFQLYVRKDREFSNRLIDRAKAAGCGALVVTMDCQHYGQRHKDVRNGLTVPIKIHAEIRRRAWR